MTIDLREELADFRDYTSEVVDVHVRAGKPRPRMIHFGYSFDQDGWLIAFLDCRPDAAWDGEWTTHLQSNRLLMRPHWYNASELSDLGELSLVGIDGNGVAEWSEHRDHQMLATILGQFITSAVAAFAEEGIFRPLFEPGEFRYVVEEFDGLFTWPLNPEIAELYRKLQDEMTGSETGER